MRKFKNKPDYVFLATILKDEDKHIGNIEIGPINRIYRFADVGIIIGEKSFWGKGFATEAIKLIVNYAFNKLKLQKLIVGANKNNLSSIKMFRKAGFTELEAKEKGFFCDDSYINSTLLKIVKK